MHRCFCFGKVCEEFVRLAKHLRRLHNHASQTSWSCSQMDSQFFLQRMYVHSTPHTTSTTMHRITESTQWWQLVYQSDEGEHVTTSHSCTPTNWCVCSYPAHMMRSITLEGLGLSIREGHTVALIQQSRPAPGGHNDTMSEGGDWGDEDKMVIALHL